MTRSDAEAVGRVDKLWRYPVKSMRGERVESALVDSRGLVGDRLFAVRNAQGKLGSGKDSTRFRRMDGLLDFEVRYVREPGTEFVAELTDPNGECYAVGTREADEAVRSYLGRDDVAVMAEEAISHFDDGPIHLMSSASLDWLAGAVEGVPVDERRLRPNLVLDVGRAGAFAEDAWVGRVLRIGDAGRGAVIEVREQTKRCVMTNAAQDDLPYSSLPLKAVAVRDLNLGVWASVVQPGLVRVGDAVVLEE
jgi:uncharacterized protein YcbX